MRRRRKLISFTVRRRSPVKNKNITVHIWFYCERNRTGLLQECTTDLITTLKRVIFPSRGECGCG